MLPLIWSAIIAALFFFPRLLAAIPHRILMFVDSIHRNAVRRFHNRWQHPTVPHLRPSPLKMELSAAEAAKWRLDCHEGRQRWFHEEKRTVKEAAAQGTFVEKYNMLMHPDGPGAEPVQPRRDAEAALRDGAAFLCKLQDPKTGHWPNDYSGPLFLTCGPVFAKYIMYSGDIDKTWSKAERKELTRYLVNMQNGDGGFGMHTEGSSTMFGTVLNYVVLRLLGELDKNHAVVAAARSWIHKNGGGQFAPSWAKVWLCVLGLYDWTGVNAVPAEMWLLPDWLPVSMGRVWCHSRLVTLSFGWLYSTRFRCAETPLLAEIRNELYLPELPYSKIDWPSCRNNVKDADLYFPTSPIYNVINAILLFYEWQLGAPLRWLREKALKKCYEHMRFDDVSTEYICLGPVNKSLNMLVAWIVEESQVNNNNNNDNDKDNMMSAAAAAASSKHQHREFQSEAVRRHLERLPDYFWMAYDGMRMSGYNGSQLWDTSFSVQAILAAPRRLDLAATFRKELVAGHGYIDVAQVRNDCCDDRRKYYRSRSKGAWNFSTRAQGWQVSDCTAEGLRCALLCREHPDINQAAAFVPLESQRLFDAVDTLLSLRVPGSGWASYEERRAPIYLELLNCAEVYKDIMVDYEYAECTSSCVHSLVLFQRQFPEYRSISVQNAIRDGVQLIKQLQRADGSWYGSWGVCFTYAAWLTTEALKLAGEGNSNQSATMRRSCEFLMLKQAQDGGWGEDFNACVSQEWRENPDGSQVVQTAWATMALLAAAAPDDQRYFMAAERGIRFIMSRQLRSGDWKQERISGVFNGNCAIAYPGYKNQMTVWALSKFLEAQELHRVAMQQHQ